MKTTARLFSRFENMMMAVTFAEAGEFGTAREIMKEGEVRRPAASRRMDREIRASRPAKTAGRK